MSVNLNDVTRITASYEHLPKKFRDLERKGHSFGPIASVRMPEALPVGEDGVLRYGVLWDISYWELRMVSGVSWVFDPDYGVRVAYPPMCWVSLDDPDYGVAPPHMAQLMFEALDLAVEIERAESAAGWDWRP